MTETTLLFILALVIFGGIIAVRHFTRIVLTPRVEAVVRITACLIAALIAHALYGAHEVGFALLLTILASAALCYAGSHVFDRLLVKG
jgi:hypothetical protein